VQLSPGLFEGASRQLRLPSIQLVRERNNVTVNQFGRIDNLVRFAIAVSLFRSAAPWHD